MDFRLACTGGAVTLVTGDGTRRRIPAGICWIGPRDTPAPDVVVRWTEGGVEYTGRISARDLTACLRGLLLQYA